MGVAKGPKIQKWFILLKTQIEKAVLRDYKRELAQKSKNRVHLNLHIAVSEILLYHTFAQQYSSM